MNHLFILGILLVSYSVTKAQDGSFGVNKKSDDSQPQFVLATVRITGSGNLNTVTIVSSQLVNGTIKDTRLKKHWTEDDFLCFILDKNKLPIDTLVISQPLKVRYEYPGENGTIGYKIEELSQKEVLIRFPYKPGMQYLRMASVEKNKELKLLNTLTIAPQN